MKQDSFCLQIMKERFKSKRSYLTTKQNERRECGNLHHKRAKSLPLKSIEEMIGVINKFKML